MVIPTIQRPKLDYVSNVTSKDITIKWEAIKDAKGYIVYRKENDKEYVDIIDSGDPLKNRKDVVDLLKHFNLTDEDKGKDKKWFATSIDNNKKLFDSYDWLFLKQNIVKNLKIYTNNFKKNTVKLIKILKKKK